MTGFIVNWNPTRWKMADDSFDEAVAKTAEGLEYHEQWSVGVRTGGIKWGDRAYLLRQERERGLIAEGYFTSVVFEAAHWDGSNRAATYADIAWTTWLPIADRLQTEVLLDQVPAITWNRLQASGTKIPDDVAPTLAAVWERHLEDLGRPSSVLPDEVPASQVFPEGAATQVLVNRYERSPQARQACVDHHGAVCAVCGFDFGERYGTLGEGYIHVHHITDLSLLDDDYEVDPINDLRPVCPNCHAMLHRLRPALSVEVLRERLQ